MLYQPRQFEICSILTVASLLIWSNFTTFKQNDRRKELYKAQYTLKKKGILPNLEKRFRRCLKALKDVKGLRKRIKKSTKPLKVLTMYPGEEPSPTKPFFKFRTGEKDLYETFRVSYYTL